MSQVLYYQAKTLFFSFNTFHYFSRNTYISLENSLEIKEISTISQNSFSHSSELIKSLQSSSWYAFLNVSFGLQETYPSGYFTRYPETPSFSYGSAFTTFTPI